MHWKKLIKLRLWVSWLLESTRNIKYKTYIKRAVKLGMIDVFNLLGAKH